jgi:hypothetical protein
MYSGRKVVLHMPLKRGMKFSLANNAENNWRVLGLRLSLILPKSSTTNQALLKTIQL